MTGGAEGYFVVPPLTPVERERPRSREEGLWGELRLELECRSAVHVGSGTPEILQTKTGQVLAEGMTAYPRRPAPGLYIPGSSLKGACRAVVEAITPSCLRVVDARPDGGLHPCGSAATLCPACRLFGAPGWRGTVAFDDAIPRQGAQMTAYRIEQRYSHPNAPRQGRRLYRRQAPTLSSATARVKDDQEMLVTLRQGAILDTTIHLHGVEKKLLGALVLVLGLVDEGLPVLRVGGGKNRGLGIVAVRFAGGHVGSLGAPEQWQTVVNAALAQWANATLAAWPAARDQLRQIHAHY